MRSALSTQSKSTRIIIIIIIHQLVNVMLLSIERVPQMFKTDHPFFSSLLDIWEPFLSP